VVVEVAEEVSEAFVPRADDRGIEIGHGGAFVFLRTDEAHAFHRADGEELGAFRHLLEGGERIDLGLGHAVDVDVGGEEIFDAGGSEALLDGGEFARIRGEACGNGENGGWVRRHGVGEWWRKGVLE
jgi:hypothetical protein